MPFGVGMDIDLSDLRAQLKYKGAAVNKVLPVALKAAAVPVVSQVQIELAMVLPHKGWEDTGLTIRSIGIIGAKSKRGRASIRIGARAGLKTVKKRVTGVQVTTNTRFRQLVKQGRRLVVFAPDKVLHLIAIGTKPHMVGNRQHPARGPLPCSRRPRTRRDRELPRSPAASCLTRSRADAGSGEC